MRWLPLVILAAVTLMLQTALVPAIAIEHIAPDWMFILAVHYALWGRWPDAAIAGWFIGLLVDLASLDRVGVHAFAFGAASWGMIRLRQVLFRRRALTRILVTLLFAFGAQVLIGGYRAWEGDATSAGQMVWQAFLVAAYTAICAPYLHWGLTRLNAWTGLRAGRGVAAEV